MVIGGAYMFGTGIFRDWWKARRVLTPPSPVRSARMLSTRRSETPTPGLAMILPGVLDARVADYKVPGTFRAGGPSKDRRSSARRYGCHDDVSANHLRDANTWFACDKHVVYSGYTNDAEVRRREPMPCTSVLAAASIVRTCWRL